MRYPLLFLVLAMPVLATAQCCSGGVPMSGNLGLPGAEPGTWQTSISYDRNSLRTLKTGSETLDDSDRERVTHSILVESGYVFTEKISVDIFLSWVRQERIIEGSTGFTDFTTTRGVGDAVVLVKYQLLSGFLVGYGLKAPLGSANEVRDDGIQLNADLQPGSGAWDHIGYMNYRREGILRPTTAISTTLTHRWRGVNDSYFGVSRYQFGNELIGIVSVSDRFTMGSLLLDPSISFRYRQAGRDTIDDFDFSSSGGEFLFINPGVSWVLSPRVNWQINLEWPLYARVNEIQLAPTLRINTGIFLTLNGSKKTITL